MIRLETLTELKILNSSFSLFSFIELRQSIIYRAIRANNISINTVPPSYFCCVLLARHVAVPS